MNKTEKKKKPNYTLGLSLILIIMAVMVYFAVTRPSDTVQANKDKQYQEVMELDVAGSYPDSPDGVLDMYILIDVFLSGNTVESFTEGDLRLLVEKERLLLHSELLEINPIETQIEAYAEKNEILRKEGIRCMQVNTETPRFSSDAQICSIGAKQYWNGAVQQDGGRTIDLVYNLKKEEDTGLWKIIGWYVNENQGEQ